jgi:hypothetical protein
MRCLVLVLFSLSYASTCLAQSAPERRNWFNDPFFQISNSFPNCPVPAGPFITEEEKRVQAHHRAERGTTCWLSGKCERPNSYAYDAEISQALKIALQSRGELKNTTLWVTTQGRMVFIEGCARNVSVAKALEAIARKVPNVQQAVALVYSGASSRPPYKRLTEP